MKVFLTGASGLLGANIARELVLRGHELLVLLRRGSDRRGIAGLPCTAVEGDLIEPRTWLPVLCECDAIIHSAAHTGLWPTALPNYYEANVEATIRLMDAAVDAGTSRVVFVSTANTIGHGSRESPGDEQRPFGLSSLRFGYIESKLLAEEYILGLVRQKGLPAVILNPTFMLGSFDLKPSSGQLLLYARNSRVLCVPPGGKNFIDVRDAAAGACNALALGLPGERYLLAGENLSYREFFDLVCRIAGRSPHRIFLPASLIRGFGSAATRLGQIFGRRPSFNTVTAKLSCMGVYYSGNKAVEELDLPQTPIECAIRRALDWFDHKAAGEPLKVRA